MIVAKPNILGSGGAPFERDAELVVHADRPFTSAVALKWMKAVAGRNTQVFDRHRRIKSLKSAPGRLDQVGRKAFARVSALEDRLGLSAFPALYRQGDRLFQLFDRSAIRYE